MNGGNTGWCNLCDLGIKSEHLVSHIENVHGLEMERWPDGGYVIEDATLTPEDFN